jgi:hypothetical protein
MQKSLDSFIGGCRRKYKLRTQRIKRFSGKAFWGKKKRAFYSEPFKEKMKFEELYYEVISHPTYECDIINIT